MFDVYKRTATKHFYILVQGRRFGHNHLARMKIIGHILGKDLHNCVHVGNCLVTVL